MASLHRFWTLKPSLRLVYGYQGKLSRAERLQLLFNSCRHGSLEGTRKLSERSLYSVTGQFSRRVFFQKEREILRKYDVRLSSSTPQDVSKEHWLCDKSEGVEHANLRFLSGACSLPHPKKGKTGGEDAFFICSEEQVVGVADGVGGWADVGVDAGDYARELMLQSRIAVAQEPHGYIDPARVMFRAHAKTKCRGSSTACILALSNYGLQAANLGDSGFILMRNGRTIFRSPVQQHQFNIPFQLECGGSDPPTAAEVSAGDVLIAGTDGLFDNLYDNELMGVIMQSIRIGSDPQVAAQKIVALARKRAEDRSRQTPFSAAAQEAGFRFYGGKMDDITVIVSYVITISQRGESLDYKITGDVFR